MADEREIYYDNEIDHVVIVSGKYVDKIKLDIEPKRSNYTELKKELIQKVSALYGAHVSPSNGGVNHIELKSENGDELYVLEWHYEKQNIVKRVCKELGLTYKQLGEAIGLSEGSIKRLATSDEINTQAVKSCEMLLEIKNLKEQLSNTQTLKTALKTLLD